MTGRPASDSDLQQAVGRMVEIRGVRHSNTDDISGHRIEATRIVLSRTAHSLGTAPSTPRRSRKR